MLWMDIDISTFPTPTLWEWVDRVKAEEKMLRAELDRRMNRAAKRTDPPTDRPFERTVDALVEDVEARRPTGGPTRRRMDRGPFKDSTGV